MFLYNKPFITWVPCEDDFYSLRKKNLLTRSLSSLVRKIFLPHEYKLHGIYKDNIYSNRNWNMESAYHDQCQTNRCKLGLRIKSTY